MRLAKGAPKYKVAKDSPACKAGDALLETSEIAGALMAAVDAYNCFPFALSRL
jgi:hypothetical protein